MGNPHPPVQKGRWQKGKSGNPLGRPKRGWTVKEMIENAMEEYTLTGPDAGKQAKQIVYEALVKLGKKGDILAIKEINNRLDGMPEAAVDITSGGDPIEFNIDAVIGLSKAPTKAAISGPKDVLKGV